MIKRKRTGRREKEFNQEISFTRIVINPNQTNLITVMSDKFIKNYKVKEESISIQPDI